MARWGYSTNLGVIEILSELDGWDGYYLDPPYNDNINTQMVTDMKSWHEIVANYLKIDLPVFSFTQKQHLLSTSYATKPWDVYSAILSNGHFAFDVTSAHKYGNDHTINHDPNPSDIHSRFMLMNFPNPTFAPPGYSGLLVDFDRPSIFGELGMDNGPDIGGGIRCSATNIEAYDDVDFHNNLWATSFMGCYGTGLNW